MIVKLSKPANVDGVPLEEITLDEARMNGRGIIAAERAAMAESGGQPPIVRALDAGFCAQLAAHAAKLSPDTIMDLGGGDFEAVAGAVRGFLLSTD